MKVVERYKLMGRQIDLALQSGISYLIPWPAHILGVYGSGEAIDGTPVAPDVSDRLMDAYVADVLCEQFKGGKMELKGNFSLVIHSVIAGRKKMSGELEPCIVVRIGLESQNNGFRKEVWAW